MSLARKCWRPAACWAAVTLLLLGAAACSAALPPLPEPSSQHSSFGGGLAGGSITDAAWTAIVDRTLNSVLLVQNTACGFTATGSGFVVSARQVVTNRHVVEGARSLSLRTRNGQQIAVTSWKYSATDDLAILQTASDLPPVLTTTLPAPLPGDLVVAVGYPLSGPQKATRGRVLQLQDAAEGSSHAQVIRTSSSVLPGNSGGPLLDTHGRVAGIVFAIDLNNGDTLVLPISTLKSLLSDNSARRGTPCSP